MTFDYHDLLTRIAEALERQAVQSAEWIALQREWRTESITRSDNRRDAELAEARADNEAARAQIEEMSRQNERLIALVEARCK